MTGPILILDKVAKSYDGATEVVRPLDLAVERGEFVTLLGPSGSGKTTILMMIAGFEEPTSGAIALEGRPLARVPAHRRGIGVVFQNYALFPHMSVAANLAFPLEMHGVGRAEREERVLAALDMVRLGGFGERRPAQLSGGQQQRVALARALVFRPKLVLMDEPLGALDKQLREHMQAEIKRLHERLGVTVVYVTHDQGEALTMSDRIAVLNRGRIQQFAPPAVIYERPANAFVASFIGETNRLPGVVVARDGDFCTLRLAGGGLVRARLGGELPEGAPAEMVVRPEKVMAGAAAGAVNRFDARIEETIYVGDHTRLRLSLPGSEVFVARAGTAGLARGQALPVSWEPESCLALPPGEADDG